MALRDAYLMEKESYLGPRFPYERRSRRYKDLSCSYMMPSNHYRLSNHRYRGTDNRYRHFICSYLMHSSSYQVTSYSYAPFPSSSRPCTPSQQVFGDSSPAFGVFLGAAYMSPQAREDFPQARGPSPWPLCPSFRFPRRAPGS